MIRAGDADIVVAGGMESMTQAPYLLPGARAGYRLGDGELVDSMMYDGLTDAFDHIAHGPLAPSSTTPTGRDLARAPGRLRRRQPREGGRRGQGGPSGRRDRPGPGAPAQGRPAAGRHRRGRAAGHHGRVARRAEARLRQGRHHHRRQRLADLRRRLRRHRHVGRQGEGAGRRRRSARSSATAWSPGPTTRC